MRIKPISTTCSKVLHLKMALKRFSLLTAISPYNTLMQKNGALLLFYVLNLFQPRDRGTYNYILVKNVFEKSIRLIMYFLIRSSFLHVLGFLQENSLNPKKRYT